MPTAFTLLLAATFLAAAVAKLRDPEPFAATVAALLPGARATRPLARAIPAAEVALAALLVSGLAPRAAAFTALLLLGAFSWALVRLRRDPSLPSCHCFGADDGDPRAGLVRNALLAAVALAALVWPADGPVWAAGAATMAGAVTVAAGAACAWALARAWRATRAPVRA